MTPSNTKTEITASPKAPVPDKSGFFSRLLLPIRIPLLIFGHAAVFVATYWLAFLLRFEFTLSPDFYQLFVKSLPILVALKLVTFYLVGHFYGWWRYVTFTDLATLFRAATIATALFVGLDYFIFPFQIPRSVIILDWGLTILTIGALRSVCRVALEQSIRSNTSQEIRRTLIIGCDFESSRLGALIQSRPEWGFKIVGYVTLNGEAPKTRLYSSSSIVGTLRQIVDVVALQSASEVLVRAGQLAGAELRKLMDDCAQSGIELKIVPNLKDHFSGDQKIPMRDIEITDLLRREPVELDTSSIAQLIEGKTVMITGAGGSIGSELCRQIIKYKPHSIILLGRGENRIFAIDLELRALKTDTIIEARIASVTDQKRMRAIYAANRPDIVFHAAAHKHVPLMEENVSEAIQNNVLGTKIVADLAAEFKVDHFVFISTDKAVNPTSVMGCTKQLSERYVMALAAETETYFMVTRFGNVLASNGSVVPLFKKQIQNGGPITVTDERMTRFFMTIPEASQLVLQAAAIGHDGQIVVLDMGEQIKVIDMARDLIRLAGLPEHAIDIEITGIRPGEKLYEELFGGDETSAPMSHPKLRTAKYQHHTLEKVDREIGQLLGLKTDSDESQRNAIRLLVSNFLPNHGSVEESAMQEDNSRPIATEPLLH